MIRLGILSSSRGTNVASIVEAIEQRYLDAAIACVISNKSDAPVLDRARHAGLQAIFVDSAGMSRDQYDQQVAKALVANRVDLLVLIGYMRILSASFVKQWRNRIINVHPSLLPAHAGLMDLAVHQAVIDAGDAVTGCTVHYVTEQVDAGPILLQRRCNVSVDETPVSLKAKVQLLEQQALVDAIRALSSALQVNRR